MKTDKLLKLIQQKKAMRSGGALPLPRAQSGIVNQNAYNLWYKYNTPEGRANIPDVYSDYDYKKYFEDAVTGVNPMGFDEESMHFPDTYKYPWHPSFSDESIYYVNQKETPGLSYQTKRKGGLAKAQTGIANPMMPGTTFATGAIKQSASPIDLATGAAFTKLPSWIALAARMMPMPSPAKLSKSILSAQPEDRGWLTSMIPFWQAYTTDMIRETYEKARDMYENANKKQNGGLAKAQPGGKKNSVYNALLNYKESPDEDKVEFFDISGLTSWDDAVKGYDSWTTSNRTYPTIPESMDMFSAVPLLGRAKKAYEGMKYVYKPWRPAVDKLYGLVDYIRETYEKSKEEKQIGGLAKAQVGEEKNENLERLLSEYKTIQSRINEGYDDSYVKKLKEVADKLVQDRFVLEQSDVVPENILNWKDPKTGDGPAFCIGTSCYIANQAGDPFKFYSNTMAQDYARDNPESTRYFEQSEKYIEPGDILQFKLSSEQGKPYHAYTVLDIGDADDKGYKRIKVVGSSGHGPVEYKDYYLGPDNKVYKSPQGSLMPTQLLKRKTTSKSIYNDAVNRRNELKKQIDAIDPRIFNPQKTVRYNTYLPTEYFPSDSAFFGGRLEDVSYDVPERPNVYVLGPGRDGFQEQIYLKDSKLPEILRMAADKKYDIMKQHNISGDEYDAIVSNMLGMYGAETKFGTDYWGKGVPEWPLLTKTLPFFSSVGPFQLGRNNFSKELKKKYSKDDMYDPIKGAQANIEFLAENIPLLRKRAYDKPDDLTYTEFITPDNYLEYIPYLQAAPGWLRGDEATKKSKKDVVRGEHDYKKLVDYYRSFFQSFPMNMQEVVITPEKKQGGKTQKVKITKRK